MALYYFSSEHVTFSNVFNSHPFVFKGFLTAVKGCVFKIIKMCYRNKSELYRQDDVFILPKKPKRSCKQAIRTKMGF